MDVREAGRRGGMIGGKSRSAAKLAAVRKNIRKAMAAKRKRARKGRA